MKELPFPEYIKFDFLLVLIGIGSMTWIMYLFYFRETSVIFTSSGIVPLLLILLLMLFGFLMFTVGFYEMAKNYNRETRLLKIKSELQEVECKLQLKSLQKELKQ